MLKKRLVGVVTVKGGRAVQSFGYNRWLPLGRVDCIVENLDRWGADEIMVLAIDRSEARSGPDTDMLRRLGKLGLRTPLVYGGGIWTADDGVAAVKAGADRIIVDAVLHHNPAVTTHLADRLGAQAIIAALPVSLALGRLEWLRHTQRESFPLGNEALENFKAREVSELMVIDWRNEGYPGHFDPRLLDALPPTFDQIPRIVYGGVSAEGQADALLRREDISAVGLGNLLNYREHAIDYCKARISDNIIRPAAPGVRRGFVCN